LKLPARQEASTTISCRKGGGPIALTRLRKYGVAYLFLAPSLVGLSVFEL